MGEYVDLSITLILVLGIGAQWLAWRLRIPSILLLLTSGFLAGPMLGWVEPDALLGDLLMPLVSISVALILFEGGLTLKLSEWREVGKLVRNPDQYRSAGLMGALHCGCALRTRLAMVPLDAAWCHPCCHRAHGDHAPSPARPA